MPTSPRISGTFLDEITHDIPSQNWLRSDWDREFQLYKRIGIDTVIIIRAGAPVGGEGLEQYHLARLGPGRSVR